MLHLIIAGFTFLSAHEVLAGTPEQDPIVAHARNLYASGSRPTLEQLGLKQKWYCKNLTTRRNSTHHYESELTFSAFKNRIFSSDQEPANNNIEYVLTAKEMTSMREVIDSKILYENFRYNAEFNVLVFETSLTLSKRGRHAVYAVDSRDRAVMPVSIVDEDARVQEYGICSL